ncbi:MAG TPA: Ig-like domain-containing protein [Gemmatimonadales bacterium]|nr:Ig-like domain-containing protein [Gemmatimonadales bacterium]
MIALFALLCVLQGVAPLRKSDLVRLLSGSAMTQQEVAQLVSRNCLTFDPTERDRQDLLRLGAEPAVLAAVDACARRRAAAARRPPPPVSAPAAPGPVPTRAPSPLPVPAPSSIARPPSVPTRRVSAERSAFVAGGGQSGSAGAQLPRALIFEARDSAGLPLAGQTVEFSGVNARVEPATVATDADGHARVGVILGQRTGPATVIAAVGIVEKQVAFNVTAGPAARLVVWCGATGLAGRVVLRPDTVVVLRVTAQDAFANAASLTGLRAAVADARIFRVLRIAQDSLAGTVALKPDQPGTTSLAVIGSGLRHYLTVTVPPRAAPGRVDCP